MVSGKGVNEVRMRSNINAQCISHIDILMVLSFKKVSKGNRSFDEDGAYNSVTLISIR